MFFKPLFQNVSVKRGGETPTRFIFNLVAHAQKKDTMAKDGAATRGVSSPPAASLGPFAAVADENTILLMSAHLTSAEASRLRSASHSCASIFIRNAPCTNTTYVYFEALEKPNLE